MDWLEVEETHRRSPLVSSQPVFLIAPKSSLRTNIRRRTILGRISSPAMAGDLGDFILEPDARLLQIAC